MKTFYFHIIKNLKKEIFEKKKNYFWKKELTRKKKRKTQKYKKAESILRTSLSLIKRNDFRLVELINPRKKERKCWRKEKSQNEKFNSTLTCYEVKLHSALNGSCCVWNEKNDGEKVEWFFCCFEFLDLRVELKYQEIYSMKFRRMRINWMKIYLPWMEVNSLMGFDESCEKKILNFLKAVFFFLIFSRSSHSCKVT